MLSKEVFKEGMKKLSILFPSWNIDLSDPETLKTWYNMLSDISDKNFKIVVDDYGFNNIYNPTIASLRKNINFKSHSERASITVTEVRDWMDE